MNKFVLIALLATVCVAHATEDGDLELESQAAAAPTDSEEVENLSGETVVFSDFCLRTRDHVLGDIKRTSNSAAANLFTLLFNSAQEVVTEALETQQKATDKLGNQMLHPDAEIVKHNDDDTIDKIITDGQERIQNDQGQLKISLNAFMSAIKATGTAVAIGIANKIKALKNIQGLTAASAIVEGACDKFADYQVQFNRDFEETKIQLVSSNPRLANIQLNQVNCVTSKRIMRMEGLCKVAKVARGPLMNLLATTNNGMNRQSRY